MLEQLLSYLHNWFVKERHSGKYDIEDGKIVLPFLISNQYFRIIGSAVNDGLYIYGNSIKDGDGNDIELQDESFSGYIWALSIPKSVISLSKEIAEWEAKYGDTALSPYSSESFAGYSYTKTGNGISGSTSDNGAGWENTFSSKLDQWRKLPGQF